MSKQITSHLYVFLFSQIRQELPHSLSYSPPLPSLSLSSLSHSAFLGNKKNCLAHDVACRVKCISVCVVHQYRQHLTIASQKKWKLWLKIAFIPSTAAFDHRSLPAQTRQNTQNGHVFNEITHLLGTGRAIDYFCWLFADADRLKESSEGVFVRACMHSRQIQQPIPFGPRFDRSSRDTRRSNFFGSPSALSDWSIHASFRGIDLLSCPAIVLAPRCR